jgi:hypothetical protein
MKKAGNFDRINKIYRIGEGRQDEVEMIRTLNGF